MEKLATSERTIPFQAAYERFDEVRKGMSEILEIDGRESRAYSYFDDKMRGITTDVLTDPHIALYVPPVVELYTRKEPSNSNGEKSEIRKDKRFVFPFKFIIYHAPEETSIDDITELASRPDFRVDKSEDKSAKLLYRDILDILIATADQMINEQNDYNLFTEHALARTLYSFNEVKELIVDRQALKEQYRQQYGEAIKQRIIEMTRLVLSSGAKLSEKYVQLTGPVMKDVPARLKIDPEDPGWTPPNDRPERHSYFWYNWKRADLILAPHYDTSDPYTSGPDLTVAEKAPSRMWCHVANLGDTLVDVADNAKIFRRTNQLFNSS